ncbi:hypothetical protein OJF2_64830 [Aquisphaera giovannonii]|uniref:Glycosyltransferase RgtA/B/C/D-like domain-containing protein n=1 Tax=Aquisphaera giovannonii TaxID=406548 RepID=A0A5B9WD67_9BACT|nr:glycosyltransferase family 39 protein [Aquisphaera giovannonii]QEH37891.1 hypothetical protein OJF2_64830 [Aquisphaera giovannonii]
MVALWGLLTNLLLGLGAWCLARRVFRLTGGVEAALGAAVVAFAWVVLGMEILGTIGSLNPGAILGWSASLAGAGLIAMRRRAPAAPPEEGGEASGVERWRLDVLAAIGMTLWASAVLGMTSLLLPVKVVSDAPIYHLYFAVRWWKAGRLFLVPLPFGENAATYFPANGDVWFSWLTIAWGGDRLARVGQAPFLVASALASFAMARRLGAGRNAAAMACCWFVACTPFLIFSFEANVDTIFIAMYLCAALFFLRAAHGEAPGRSLALGGLGAGLSLGTKSVGVVFVIPLLALAIATVFARVRPIGRALRLAGLVGLAAVATGGYWYARNWLVTGNPVYPLRVTLLGRDLLPGCYDASAMRRSMYYIPREDLGALGDTLLAALDPRMAIFWLAALLGAWGLRAAGHRPPGLDRGTWAMSGLAVLNVVFYWAFIPYRTQQRFMLQAMGLAAVPLARMFDRRIGVFGPVAMGLLALHLLTPATWPVALEEANIPWDLSPLIPNTVGGTIRVFDLARDAASGRASLRPAPAAVLWTSAATGSCALLAAWAAGRRRPLVASAGLIGLAAAAAFGTGAIGADPRLLMYPGFRDFHAGWMNLEGRSGPEGVRVAYAGTNIPYYLFGGQLRNEVRYVNVDGHRDWLLHDYQRAAASRGEPPWPNSRPGWDRSNPDYDAWLANLEAERIQLLVVTRADPGEGAHNVADAERFPIERAWADRHPSRFEPLYGPAEGDPFFRIYRLRPRPR